jgi:hypothetical protein
MSDDITDALLGFADLSTFSQEADGRVVATVEGGADESRAKQEIWGAAPLHFRPSEDGEVEAIIVRQGDELISIATRDLAWKMTLVDGEVALTALGTDPAVVRLRPNGELTIEGTIIKLGSEAAAALAARADLTDARLASLVSQHNLHVHATVTGLGTPTVPAVPMTGQATVACAKVKIE